MKKKVYPRLNLIKEENLKGIVTSIGVVRIKPTSGSPSETDSLMFTFKNAKVKNSSASSTSTIKFSLTSFAAHIYIILTNNLPFHRSHSWNGALKT